MENGKWAPTYQLKGAMRAPHETEVPTWAPEELEAMFEFMNELNTDWPQILALYEVPSRGMPSEKPLA